MTLGEYQAAAKETAIYPDKHRVVYPALGLAGEAGELANKIKKVLRDEHGRFSDSIEHELAAELGDVLWYVAAIANDIGFGLDQIADMNLAKLRDRAARGKLQGSGDNR